MPDLLALRLLLLLLFVYALLGALRHSDVPVKSQCSKDIKDNVHPHDAEIAPSMAVTRADGSKENIGVANGAEATIGGGARVEEVTTVCVNVRLHIGAAGATGRLKVEVFIGGACDLCVCEAD